MKWYVIIDTYKITEYETEAEAFKAYVEIKKHPGWNRVRNHVEMKNNPNPNQGRGICASRILGKEWKFDNATGWTKETEYKVY